jgi:hypothetical protein
MEAKRRGAKQACRNMPKMEQITQENHSEAKALLIQSSFCGTAEAAPFQNSTRPEFVAPPKLCSCKT